MEKPDFSKFTFEKLSGRSGVVKAVAGKTNIFHHGLGVKPTVPIITPHSDTRFWVTQLDAQNMKFEVSSDCLVTCTVVQ